MESSEADAGSVEDAPFVDLLAAPPPAAEPAPAQPDVDPEPSAAAQAKESVPDAAPSVPLPPAPSVPDAPAPLPPAPSVPPPLPPTVADAVRSTAAEIISTDDENSRSEALEDIVLRSTTPRASASTPSGATSLAATVEIIEHAGTLGDLQALLQQSCVHEIAVGVHADAVSRCVQYVGGLARPEERVLCGWPVLSINEWGTQQVRIIVLSSHALYRVAFSHQKGAIDHYSRTSLGNLQCIERGRYAFKLLLTEPDGRENPVSYFWSAYVKKGAKDSRFERVYYPIHPEAMPVELVLACIISSIAVANRLLCDAVGAYCYVSKMTVRDYVPNPNVVDDMMDKLVPALKVAGDKVSDAMKAIVNSSKETARSVRERNARRSTR